MRRFDIYKIYHELSREYGIPIPVYFLHQGRLRLRAFNEYVGGARFFCSSDSEISGLDDPFGIIFLSCTVSLSSAIHEFYHYLDYFCGDNFDEESTVLRTCNYVNENRLENAGRGIFENRFDHFLNMIKKILFDLIQDTF